MFKFSIDMLLLAWCKLFIVTGDTPSLLYIADTDKNAEISIFGENPNQ